MRNRSLMSIYMRTRNQIIPGQQQWYTDDIMRDIQEQDGIKEQMMEMEIQGYKRLLAVTEGQSHNRGSR